MTVLLLTLIYSTVQSDLQLYYKDRVHHINTEHEQHRITIDFQVLNYETFATPYQSIINAFTKPGRSISPEITSLIATMTNQHNKISNLFNIRDKYLKAQSQLSSTSCTTSMSIFSLETSKELLQELTILKDDLPAASTVLSSQATETPMVESLLIQVTVNLRLIKNLLNSEIIELQFLTNGHVSDKLIFTAQNSSCLNSEKKDKFFIKSIRPYATGLQIQLDVFQYDMLENGFSLIATPIFNKKLDLNNTFEMAGTLQTCTCVAKFDNVLTGCTCDEFSLDCKTALLNRDFLQIFSTCPMTTTDETFPIMTQTGLLFPKYMPFQLDQTSLTNLIPLQDMFLPFHVTSSKVFKIKNHKSSLVYRPPPNILTESIDLINMGQDVIDHLNHMTKDTPYEKILNYVSYALAILSALLLIPLSILSYLRSKRNNKDTLQLNRPIVRRPVNFSIQQQLM